MAHVNKPLAATLATSHLRQSPSLIRPLFKLQQELIASDLELIDHTKTLHSSQIIST